MVGVWKGLLLTLCLAGCGSDPSADGGVSAVGPPKEILAAETTNERLRTFLARFRASHF